MSTVNLVYHILKKEWVASANQISSRYCNLQIGFRSSDNTVAFDNLNFGFKLETNGIVIQEEKFPEDDNIVYRSTTEPYLINTELKVSSDTNYTVYVWASNNNERSEFVYNFHTPKETDTGHYENSSVPHPDPTNAHKYKFDESTRSWVRK